ncbi:rho GTPase-activating protein 22 isoform X2 [Pungitius pungitius]
MVLGELSRVSRPCSPLGQEKALKAGWLKRQRSIMKNWQLRWFVLRTEALYFYKDQDETKAQGCIPLQGSQVNELPVNQDEPGRHPFEIVPGVAGEKDRTGLSHESFLLMANSQSDMEDWVRAIRRVIWAPLGGGVFGQHLEETMLCEAQCGPQRLVPVLVEQCVCFIREHGLQEEGLFRAPGQTNHVRELQDAFDRGEKPVFDSTTDVHTVASLLKLYIRELPEPIIPFSKYTQFLSCAQLLTKDKEMGNVELGKQVKSLPQVNNNLLTYICKFLDEVQSHSSENKMSVQNLATVFGPNILRPRVEDPVTMMEGSTQVQHLMTVLISEHTKLYQREEVKTETKIPPEQQQQQSSIQRCKVEWLTQEDTASPAPKTPKEELKLSTPSKDSEPTVQSPITMSEKGEDGQNEAKGQGKTEERMDGQADGKNDARGGSEAAVSPSRQSKALPAWRSNFKGGAASGGQRGKMGGSAGDVSAAGGSNWLMNGLSSLRAHKRTTSSGERLKDSSLKDSTLSLKEATVPARDTQRHSDEDSSQTPLYHRALLQSHRLSAYDNVAPSSLSLPADTSSTWTSFEISLAEPEGRDKAAKLGRGQERPIEVTDSSSPLDNSAKGPEEGTNEGLKVLLSELKQELKEQRTSNETSIRKLEESCSEYQSQVNRLEEELDQEKKKFHMLEIRFRNSERAHQDAENRNVLLQKEMEEFFKTLGDLTTGATRTN